MAKNSKQIENVQSQNESVTGNLKMKEILAYGVGNFALALLLTTAGLIMYFYTEIVGIGAGIVGTILFVGRLLDGVTDVSMGMIVDKTESKHGKARPWLLWMAIPLGLSIAILFSSPGFGTTGKTIYALITYIFATAIIYTAASIPHMTMMSTMTQDQFQRGKLSISKTAFGALGGVAINAITLPLVSFYGGGERGWLIMGVTYGILATLLLLYVFKNTEERTIIDLQKTSKKNKVSLKDNLQAIIKNKYWLITVCLAFVLAFVMGLRGGSDVYFADYILGNPNLIGAMSAAQTIPMLVMLIIVGPLMKKFSKRDLAIGGYALLLVGALVTMINPASLTFVVIGKLFSGGGGLLLGVVLIAMIADTADYGEWKTGVRNEGTLFAAESFGLKVGTGFGGMLLGWLLSFSGYVGGKATQTPEVIFAIKFLNIHMMIILSIISIILLLFYKLDKEYPRIMTELKERRNS